MAEKHQTLRDFYPYYLSQNLDRRTRVMHYSGTVLGLGLLGCGVVTGRWWVVALALVLGHAFAWTGHFIFEKNISATFACPVYSLVGDFVMTFEAATGRLRLPE